MFNKTQLDAYANIKAPDELFEKVSGYEPKKKPIYLIPLVSSLAACLILIFGIAAFGQSFQPKVIFNGQELTSSIVFYDISPANEFDMRSSPELCVPLEIGLDKETEVTVSEGSIILDGNTRHESVTLDGTASFVWVIQRTGAFPECKMTLENEDDTAIITLTQNETDGSFTAQIN